MKKIFLKQPQKGQKTPAGKMLSDQDCQFVQDEEKRHMLLLDLEKIEAALILKQFLSSYNAESPKNN